jgi:TRAP-type mannitol/chloroaromatic compound transport system permease small subunit
MKHRADVRIDFLYERFSVRGQAAVDVVASLLTVAIGAVIAWLAFSYVSHSYSMNEGSPDPGGLAMRYLLKAFIPLGFMLLVVQGFADLLRGLVQFSDPDNPAELPLSLNSESA